MFAIIIFSLICVQLANCAMPWEPAGKGGGWEQRHQGFVRNSQQNKDKIKAVFIGASVTEYWNIEGRNIWNSYYAGKGAVNYGIGGDTTSNVIYRIQNHELDGLNQVKVVVFSCGPGIRSELLMNNKI